MIYVSVILILFYAAVRLRFELTMLQQNSYRPVRYLRWLTGGGLSVTDLVTDLLLLAVVMFSWYGRWASYMVLAVGLICGYKGWKLLARRYKKPLVFTARAWRLYVVSLIIALGVVVCCAVPHWMALGVVVFAPVVLMAAWVVLWPVEWFINRWYIDDARRILRSMPELVVIGVTGSYGKTSTKHALYRILSERFSVVMTPGSFNTTLGVVRTVREHLKPYTQIFIVEMGAKNVGDIAEICALVRPTIGVLTSIGPQHLESFGTMERVQRAKFELIDALPEGGLAVVNDDFELVRERPIGLKNVFRYTSDEAKSADFETQLVGRHNLGNILAASIVARWLGMTDAEIRYGISQLRPVEHRLEVTRRGGLTIIDDAFNSNPAGAAMALEVLGEFTSGRRIVVTPGMIELGARQAELNRELGRQMAVSCDYAVVVGEYNRSAIVAGLREGGFAEDGLFLAKDFAAATAWVRAFVRAGDVVLYENDLPDTFK